MINNKRKFYSDMAKLSKVDARLLESLEAKYGTNGLVTAIQSIIPSNVDILPNEAEGLTPEEATLDFLRKLEGHCIRLQEIHWNTRKMNTHKTTDDMFNVTQEILSLLQDVTDAARSLNVRVTNPEDFP